MDSSSAHWSGPLFESRVVVSRPIRVKTFSRKNVRTAIGETKRSNVDHFGGGAQRSPFYRQGSQASCLIRERTTETARRACSSRAMRCLHVQARADTELCIKCTNSFQISGTERCLPRSLTQETGSVSSRVALPRLPRVEEGLHHRVTQLCGRADQLTTLLPMFFGINKFFRERLCQKYHGIPQSPPTAITCTAFKRRSRWAFHPRFVPGSI